MGTNYYAVRNRPTIEQPIHIGKSSLGWRFNFQRHNERWHDPPVIWNTYEQVVDWLKEYTVDTDEYVIIDEYERAVSLADFIHMVNEKQSIDNPDNFSYCDNVNGYRFSNEEFC